MTPSCEAEKEDQRYFNSPPHKKNHIATTMINTVFFKISTHILTKRMTIIHSFAAPAIYISTHILTKRMTDGFPTFCILCVISTHILTKRMTTLQQLVRLSERYFNSHPHEEDDPDAAWQSATYCYFNSHPHEEDDCNFPLRAVPLWYFNSHPHEEDDFYFLPFLIKRDISTHILTKRMTELNEARKNYRSISTHILTKRMTSSIRRERGRKEISTHILTKRMTFFKMLTNSYKIFQLTSSRRGWLICFPF